MKRTVLEPEDADQVRERDLSAPTADEQRGKRERAKALRTGGLVATLDFPGVDEEQTDSILGAAKRRVDNLIRDELHPEAFLQGSTLVSTDDYARAELVADFQSEEVAEALGGRLSYHWPQPYLSLDELLEYDAMGEAVSGYELIPDTSPLGRDPHAVLMEWHDQEAREEARQRLVEELIAGHLPDSKVITYLADIRRRTRVGMLGDLLRRIRLRSCAADGCDEVLSALSHAPQTRYCRTPECDRRRAAQRKSQSRKKADVTSSP